MKQHEVTHETLREIQKTYDLDAQQMCHQLNLANPSYYSLLRTGKQPISPTLAIIILHMKRSGPLSWEVLSQIRESTQKEK